MSDIDLFFNNDVYHVHYRSLITNGVYHIHYRSLIMNGVYHIHYRSLITNGVYHVHYSPLIVFSTGLDLWSLIMFKLIFTKCFNTYCFTSCVPACTGDKLTETSMHHAVRVAHSSLQ